MQFIDLKTQFERIEDDVFSRVSTVLQSQKYVMGPEIAELEEKLAEYAGVRHAISCSSGTDALVIPLMGYDLKATDAVFVPSFTFFASAESITLAGGTPVFVDSDATTFNLSPADLDRAIDETLAEGKLTPRGIITVDLFGQPADYDEILAIADKHGLFVIEDAAQGFGGEYKGAKAGSFGNVASTSFFPAKPLGCYGDGGAIFTDDDDLAELIKSIRVHGQGSDKYDNVRIGVNGRLDSIQAAVLLSKLAIFDSEVEARNQVANAYSERLSDVLAVPAVTNGKLSVWAQYTLVAKDADERTAIIDACKAAGVPTAIYYPIPIHLSTAYKNLGYKLGDLPVCEDLANRVFSIPMHPYLQESDIEQIVAAVKEGLR
ncbi:DegT/DnrJ/EryC1/StrS family aminotransferase [Raoultibacter timonensis]|uniref:DegT/DnrJ/EryC1/StrS family aminotransferase n=1 Tax=Raoultibacter timonensis TaxID=1907662 RepID=UPI000C82F62C|nr:DegT/DnrJ/EryC1/StrS family aminotransferase [Raoultibacter timonensis]